MHGFSALLNDFLDASNDAVVEHDLDAVGVPRRFGENPVDNALRELPAALVLLLHDTHLHPRLDLRSSLAVHDSIMVQDFVPASNNSRGIVHESRELR